MVTSSVSAKLIMSMTLWIHLSLQISECHFTVLIQFYDSSRKFFASVYPAFSCKNKNDSFQVFTCVLVWVTKFVVINYRAVDSNTMTCKN